MGRSGQRGLSHSSVLVRVGIGARQVLESAERLWDESRRSGALRSIICRLLVWQTSVLTG